MSNNDTAILVDALSKSYTIGHDAPRVAYHSLRDTLVRHGKNYCRKAVDMARGRQIIQGDSMEEFWALKDVSFEVKRGDVLGIIGRNGAGKSTLLKILSRITEPTSGRVVLNGRVASLLEVGTGFHPELTGRENIFLNGSILGMTKAEIKAKFDEIVDFAEVEKFLDTPVKRCSSGMYVRLAFAVAAHLAPEILIIDEVLAVGDTQFQKKCLGKMQEVGKGGRTVLFVSHNMGALSTLCQYGLLLQKGSVDYAGPIGLAITKYSEQGVRSSGGSFPRVLSKEMTLNNFYLTPNPVKSGGRIAYVIEIASTERVEFEGLAILFYSAQGTRVGIVDLRSADRPHAASPEAPLMLTGDVQLPNLVEGEYAIGLFVFCPLLSQNVMDLIEIAVTQNNASSIVPYPASARGIVDFDFIAS
jgi:lipopolysaccharide transport system ATP-binding protein